MPRRTGSSRATKANENLLIVLQTLEQLDHPVVRRLVERVEEVILKSGRPKGTVPSAGASWQQLFDRGYRMVVGPHDVALLRDAAQQTVREYTKFRAERATGAAP